MTKREGGSAMKCEPSGQASLKVLISRIIFVCALLLCTFFHGFQATVQLDMVASRVVFFET